MSAWRGIEPPLIGLSVISLLILVPISFALTILLFHHMGLRVKKGIKVWMPWNALPETSIAMLMIW